MQYSLDLHLHADHDPATGKWHGERPDKLAAAIIAGDLDAAVIVEHDHVSSRVDDVKAEVARIRAKLARDTGQVRKEVYVGLGVEMSLRYDGDLYHVGYAFEQDVSPDHLPSIPDRGADISVIEELRSQHAGIATFSILVGKMIDAAQLIKLLN